MLPSCERRKEGNGEIVLFTTERCRAVGVGVRMGDMMLTTERYGECYITLRRLGREWGWWREGERERMTLYLTLRDTENVV